MRRSRDIIRRSKGNPLIALEDLPFRCSKICTAGAVKMDGAYVLVLSIQSLEGINSLYVARGNDGYTFDVEPEPLVAPTEQWGEYNQFGVMDGRITYLEDSYYIIYDVYGIHGYRLAIARTKDFKSIERLGFISQPDTKAGVLFPRKVKGKYARLDRPWNGGSIWICYSDDLIYWGWPEVVLTPRQGFWDTSRIGAATVPAEIDEGWLVIYYGVKDTSGGPLFRLGAVLLDRDDPARVVGRTNVPILSPREDYERIGDASNLVFSCGAVLEPGGEVKLYYGASDSCICVGTTKVETIVAACMESERKY